MSSPGPINQLLGITTRTPQNIPVYAFISVDLFHLTVADISEGAKPTGETFMTPCLLFFFFPYLFCIMIVCHTTSAALYTSSPDARSGAGLVFQDFIRGIAIWEFKRGRSGRVGPGSD